MEDGPAARQRILHYRPSAWPRLAFGREHRLCRRQAVRNVACWDTAPNLRLPLLILLDCSPFNLFSSPGVLGVSLPLFIKQTTSSSMRDSCAAEAVKVDLNIAGGEEGGPPFNWRGQVQLEHRQRDGLLRLTWRISATCLLVASGSGIGHAAEHGLSDQESVLMAGGAGRFLRTQKGNVLILPSVPVEPHVMINAECR
jgi:hypothetical protein